MTTENKRSALTWPKVVGLLLSGMGVGWLIGLSVSPVVHIVVASLIAFVVTVTSALAGVKVEQKEDQTSQRDAPNRKFQVVEVNPLPLMCTVMGIVIGASLGVYGRTNNWLGPNPGRFVEQWKHTGISEQELSRRLFDELYPPRPGSAAPVAASPAPETGGQNPSESGTAKTNAEKENSGPSSLTTPRPEVPKSSAPAKAGPSKSEVSTFSETSKQYVGALFTVSSEKCKRFRAARDESLRDELETSGDGNLEQAARGCQDLACLKNLVAKACPKSR